MSIERAVRSIRNIVEKVTKKPEPISKLPDDPQISSEYDWLHATTNRPTLVPPEDWTEEATINKP